MLTWNAFCKNQNQSIHWTIYRVFNVGCVTDVADVVHNFFDVDQFRFFYVNQNIFYIYIFFALVNILGIIHLVRTQNFPKN